MQGYKSTHFYWFKGDKSFYERPYRQKMGIGSNPGSNTAYKNHKDKNNIEVTYGCSVSFQLFRRSFFDDQPNTANDS